MIRNWQHIVSGDLQSKHFPVVLQGVFTSNLCAFAGAATFLARFIAASRSEQTLFIPTMKTTFFGPCAIQETRLEFPSIFTITPSLIGTGKKYVRIIRCQKPLSRGQLLTVNVVIIAVL